MTDPEVATAVRRVDLGRVLIAMVLVVGTAAIVMQDRWEWVFGADEAQTQDVDAPTIDVAEIDVVTDRLFRITPGNGSEARYVVRERLVGTQQTTVGTTSVVGGDILVDTVDASRSWVGEIVVNVEMFMSDSDLRDKRLRHDFLESTHYPFVRFQPTAMSGLPVEIVEGEPVAITITGDLTVKETTASVVFEGSVVLHADHLTAEMSAVIRGSEFDVGPINIARLAHTDDEITLEFDLVAHEVDLDSELSGSLDTDLPPDEFAGGAFAAEVQPVLEANCVGCHISGGPGWSTVAFDTAGDAAAIADDIALVTGAGYMPPWLPSNLSVDFHGDWSLTDEELATLQAWAANGGGLDVAPGTALTATAELLNPIRRDIVTRPLQPYVGSLDKKDDYRCQVYEVPDPEGDGTWITGISFEPDQKSVVHHAIISRVPASALAEIERRSAEDEQPGYECFVGEGLTSDGVYSIAGWAPGQQPAHYPEGVGIFLESGDVIVNQIHYHFDHETPPDRSTIVLQTASPEEVAAGMRHIQGRAYTTPAEMPCTPEERATGAPLCDRSAVLVELAELYGPTAALLPDIMIRFCGGELSDYDQLDGTVAHSTCDLPAANTGTIFSVLGHMHEFGKAYRMTLHPDTPEEIVLLDIPVWSFEWQLNYLPVDDIRIERGDIVRFECWWDRSLVHLDEPRYVTWNEGTVDEMCYSSIRVIPDP
ncbi:MAG: YceI family protein [Acidimicrobiales bacterium]